MILRLLLCVLERIRIIAIVVSFLPFATATAQLSIPKVISSDMILQQGQLVPIWGYAKPGERITVAFGNQKVKTRANEKGEWMAKLQPMVADTTSRTLVIKGKKETINCENVVVGEVWLASGQSNMAYRMKLERNFAKPLKGEDLAAEEIQKPANKRIRVFVSGGRNNHGWAVADRNSLPNVSAPGYFFVKKLQEQLGDGVPVGVITAAVGGTRIETWTPRYVYANSPMFSNEMHVNGKIEGVEPGSMYNRLVDPIVPFAVKGTIWYQGENNCGIGDKRYAEKYKMLVDSWRMAFDNNEMPFYYVLLCPHVYSDRMHRNGAPQTSEALPMFWQEQIRAKSMVENTDFISVSDLVDNIYDIHPSYKWTVGERLARLALKSTYGVANTICHGPIINNVKANEGKLLISFNNVAEGLQTSDKKRVSWFEIAGTDGIFRPAVAEIKGSDIVVAYHSEIAHPQYVRFCWHERAQPNLQNSAGLPAVPFASTRAE